MVICCDIDGCLTDGKIWVDHQGNIIKSFNNKDIGAIKELISMGYQVHLVTASSWPGAEQYLRRSGAELHIIRNKETIPFDYQIAIGDSAWDIPMLCKAKHLFCPADASLEVKCLDGVHPLMTPGGQGIMLELVRILSNWGTDVDKF
jgi:3-deoxy-D-manno-octulosonate 8-phosphate phosphatase (KDO 8-P phosphatase)